jgi:hypothetical protein
MKSVEARKVLLMAHLISWTIIMVMEQLNNYFLYIFLKLNGFKYFILSAFGKRKGRKGKDQGNIE